VRTPAVPGSAASTVNAAAGVASSPGITADEVRKYVADRLAPYKQIRGGVVFLDELPRGTLGKILRKDLRERAIGEVKKERGAKL
jgi:4-coumarate--CoA ligase